MNGDRSAIPFCCVHVCSMPRASRSDGSLFPNWNGVGKAHGHSSFTPDSLAGQCNNFAEYGKVYIGKNRAAFDTLIDKGKVKLYFLATTPKEINTPIHPHLNSLQVLA